MCEGKFVPVSPTRNVATEHVQCTAASGLGWWESRISSRLCQRQNMSLKVMCQPMTGCVWEHATCWTTESDVFLKSVNRSLDTEEQPEVGVLLNSMLCKSELGSC